MSQMYFLSKTLTGLNVGVYFDECLEVLDSCHIADILCGDGNVP